jgi:hypothetical protein
VADESSSSTPTRSPSSSPRSTRRSAPTSGRSSARSPGLRPGEPTSRRAHPRGRHDARARPGFRPFRGAPVTPGPVPPPVGCRHAGPERLSGLHSPSGCGALPAAVALASAAILAVVVAIVDCAVLTLMAGTVRTLTASDRYADVRGARFDGPSGEWMARPAWRSWRRSRPCAISRRRRSSSERSSPRASPRTSPVAAGRTSRCSPARGPPSGRGSSRVANLTRPGLASSWPHGPSPRRWAHVSGTASTRG